MSLTAGEAAEGITGAALGGALQGRFGKAPGLEKGVDKRRQDTTLGEDDKESEGKEYNDYRQNPPLLPCFQENNIIGYDPDF